MGQGEQQQAEQELPSDLLPLITGSPTHCARGSQTTQPLPHDSGALPRGGKGTGKVPGYSKDWPTEPRRLALGGERTSRATEIWRVAVQSTDSESKVDFMLFCISD